MNLHNVEFVRSAASLKDCPHDRLPQIAFAGRSNVGKSSVINRLLQRKNFARVGEAPGKTTHINYFLVDQALYLVDLPGYGFAKVPKAEKERWAKLIESYFADPDLITLGVLIVDARHKPTERLHIINRRSAAKNMAWITSTCSILKLISLWMVSLRSIWKETNRYSVERKCISVLTNILIKRKMW